MAQKKSGWETWRAKKAAELSAEELSEKVSKSMRKQAGKTKKKTTGKITKKATKAFRKIHPAFVVTCILFLVIGICLGAYYAHSEIINDKYVLNGEKVMIYSVGDTISYQDEGVTCISKGEDISSEITIDTNMTKDADGKYTADTTEQGEYYITYTMDSGRYKGLSRVRVIKVMDAGGES